VEGKKRIITGTFPDGTVGIFHLDADGKQLAK